MRIGLDFDGVIANCGELKTLGAKELFGRDIPAEKFKKEIVVGEGWLTMQQYRELQRLVYCTAKIGMCMQPVEGMLEYLKKLQEDGHDVHVITSRETEALDIAQAWTAKLGLQLPFVGLGYGISKAEAAQHSDVYIDDDLEKLLPLVGVVHHRFLMHWGYNSAVETGTIATRVHSWEEFYTRITELSV